MDEFQLGLSLLPAEGGVEAAGVHLGLHEVLCDVAFVMDLLSALICICQAEHVPKQPDIEQVELEHILPSLCHERRIRLAIDRVTFANEFGGFEPVDGAAQVLVSPLAVDHARKPESTYGTVLAGRKLAWHVGKHRSDVLCVESTRIFAEIALETDHQVAVNMLDLLDPVMHAPVLAEPTLDSLGHPSDKVVVQQKRP